jgi:RecB family exonuclease
MIATATNNFPDAHLLTHSAESAFKTCPRKFFLQYELGLRPAHQSEPLRLGNAVHVGLETLKNGGDEEMAGQVVRDVYDTSDRPGYLTPEEFAIEADTAVALTRGYARRWKDQNVIEYVAVELPFDLPITNPQTGHATPVFRSAGKIDAIVRLPDGRLALMEHKTTSDELSPDSDYWRRLMMDSQISRYVLAARELGYDVQTTIYDVIRKPGIKPKNVAKADRAWATSQGFYFGLKLTAECPERETPEMYGARLLHDTVERPDFYFARNEIPRLDTDIEEFRFEQWQIQRTIRQAQQDGRWYRNTNACVHPYRCQFFDVCRGLKGNVNEEIPPGFRRAERLHEELVVLPAHLEV